MAIPDFTNRGILPRGIWVASIDEIVDRFCATPERRSFKQAIENISAFALRTGATRIIFGGSFIADSDIPSDLDILIVYQESRQIEVLSKTIEVESVAIDVMFCSEEQASILSSYVALFSRTRHNLDAGIIELHLSEGSPLLEEIIEDVGEATLEATRWAYFQRQISIPKAGRKILVTVHGIKTHAAWNADVTRLASASGWIVCPFIYGYQGLMDYCRKSRRDHVVGLFREFIFEVKKEYGDNISILCHSFGTYIVGKYIYGWEQPPVRFKTIILTGSILKRDLDFGVIESNALCVINEYSKNDSVIVFAQLSAFLVDPIIGGSGRLGFNKKSSVLIDSESQIFNHYNVIKRDTVAHRWLPQLELNARLPWPLKRVADAASPNRSSALLPSSSLEGPRS